VNFLLGYLAVQNKDLDHAESYLHTASTLDPHNAQAPTMLGRILLQKGEYEAARTALEQAVAADPEYWMAHNLLADAYLKQHEYEKAVEQARLAMEKGKGAGNSSQLILGEALGNLGRNQEAVQALKAYLQDSPSSPTAPQVRDMIAELEHRASNPPQTTTVTAVKAVSPLASTDPLLNEADPTVSIKTWEPPGIDEMKPYVAADVTCPLQQVIDAAGARVKQLVDDVSQIAAIEDLVHERVDELGNPVTRETRKFNYVVSISETPGGLLSTDEYRTDQSGFTSFPDQIGTQGFTGLALVFHPDMRDNFQMTCEGLGEWKGQAVWLVHFRQRDDRPNRIHSYKVGEMIYPVNLKGRAWITADKFQIVHMESELVKSMPKIQLISEHQVVDYGPVLFQKKNVQLWLPKSAQIYFDFRKRRYVRRHSFDHYMLFAVDATDKQGAPKAAQTTTPAPQPPAQPPQQP
jgi:tetratricopeptide (TPR) repeat protein